MFGHVRFSFLTAHFYAVTNRTFCDAAFDLPSTFFCFCNTCLFVTFRTFSSVADRNIILLYSGMVSKSIRYKVILNLTVKERILNPKSEPVVKVYLSSSDAPHHNHPIDYLQTKQEIAQLF